MALIIAQALKNKEGGDASQVEVSHNSKVGEMNHDSFDGESNARRPSSGERIPSNGKYNICYYAIFVNVFADKKVI